MHKLEPPTYRRVSSYAYPSFSETEFKTRHKRIREWMEGKDKNKALLERMTQASFEQGLSARKLEGEELFAEETWQT